MIAVTGVDRLTFLDAVTTQAVASAEPGTGLGALALDAHGRPLAMFEVLVLEEQVLLIVPDGAVRRSGPARR